MQDASIIWKKNREHCGIERSHRALKEVMHERNGLYGGPRGGNDRRLIQGVGKDFLKDQPWILKTNGGYNVKGEYRCIRVRNMDTGERLLVSSEGFDYPRYIGIEPDDVIDGD